MPVHLGERVMLASLAPCRMVHRNHDAEAFRNMPHVPDNEASGQGLSLTVSCRIAHARGMLLRQHLWLD